MREDREHSNPVQLSVLVSTEPLCGPGLLPKQHLYFGEVYYPGRPPYTQNSRRILPATPFVDGADAQIKATSGLARNFGHKRSLHVELRPANYVDTYGSLPVSTNTRSAENTGRPSRFVGF